MVAADCGCGVGGFGSHTFVAAVLMLAHVLSHPREVFERLQNLGHPCFFIRFS